MIISKKGKDYLVEDKGTYWLIKYSMGKLDVEYKVDKTAAADFDVLKDKIMTDKAF